MQVIIIGSFVQDLTFHCADFPKPGETIIGQFVTGPGGKGSNQAVAAARAGAQVGFIGAVGRDAFGASARAFQENEGIRWLAAEKPDRPTGTAAILVNRLGQNQIVVSLDANEALTPADIDLHADALRAARVVVTQLEANLPAEARALELARAGGATTILNPAPMRPDFDPALLAHVDILIPNESEFCALVNQLPPLKATADLGFDEAKLATLPEDLLHKLCREFGLGTIIVTLGGRGCLVSQAETYALLPASPGIKAVDTTGAGDAFVGAFAAALAEFGPAEIERAAGFANAGAGLSVTKPGTAPAMPTRAEIDALLANYQG